MARILLMMTELGKPDDPEQYIPKISQETLAEMIGTTRSRVSFFMNRFRKLGFIEYNGRIKVHKSLRNAVLLDRLPEVTPRGLQLRPLRELDRSLPGPPSIGTIGKIRAECGGTQRTRNHARIELVAGLSWVSVA